MKTAILYDRVNKWGGAERVLLALNEIFPDAPLYTSVYNPHSAQWAEAFPKVIPSFLQKIPKAKFHHELLAPLMPAAFESFNLGRYDLIISVTSEAAKAVITKPHQKHICYCLTPTRYLWSGHKDYLNTNFKRTVSKPLVSYLRKADKNAAHRPDIMIAISGAVQKRIKKYYNRDSKIIFPPVNISHRENSLLLGFAARSAFSLDAKYFLLVSRLVPYKKVDLAIRVFNQLKLPLVIVGSGSEERKLKNLAKKNIKFAGFVDEKKLQDYYQNCKALVFPQNEDFGIVAVEALSYGKPVIAYKKGGALDIVKEGKNGLLFSSQTEESLANTIKKLFTMEFDSDIITSTARKFGEERFKKEFLNLI